MEKSYYNVSENLKRVLDEINEAVVKYNRKPETVRLMVVTKTVPAEIVNEAVALGVDLIGENKAQELLDKYDAYDKDKLDIHFIGHLQSNKARQIIDKVSLIQSVDRTSLAREIDAQAKKHSLTAKILIEVNIGGEKSKSGVSPDALEELLLSVATLDNIRAEGLMTIPPVCDNILQIEQYFYRMQQLLVDMRAKNIDNVSMDVLSMGMSGDFIPAIKHGANIIRVGTAIFGKRDYI